MKRRGGRVAVLARCTPSTGTGSVLACSHCLAASSPRQAADPGSSCAAVLWCTVYTCEVTSSSAHVASVCTPGGEGLLAKMRQA